MISMAAGLPGCAPLADGERVDGGRATRTTTLSWRPRRRFIPTIRRRARSRARVRRLAKGSPRPRTRRDAPVAFLPHIKPVHRANRGTGSHPSECVGNPPGLGVPAAPVLLRRQLTEDQPFRRMALEKISEHVVSGIAVHQL